MPLESLKWSMQVDPFANKEELERELSEWVLIDNVNEENTTGQAIVPAQPCTIVGPPRPGFFDNWPSFGVYDKMKGNKSPNE